CFFFTVQWRPLFCTLSLHDALPILFDEGDFMRYKLIPIDMDDTLLTTAKEISEKNKNMIQRAMANGTKIVLCSGRPHKAMYDYRSEEHTSELQSRFDLVCRLLLEKT